MGRVVLAIDVVQEFLDFETPVDRLIREHRPMELDNRTRFPAMLYRTLLDDDALVVAAAIVRVTFALGAEGPKPASSQPWKVTKTPVATPYGVKESDDLYYREGADVFLLGHARSEGARPVNEVEVRVEIGDFVRSVVVLGDRRWERGAGGELTPSAPEPFVEMPLTVERAYGGKDTWDELVVPSPDNPEGRGFILEEENADLRPLPNLEDPAQRIARWDDRPTPAGVGFCPSSSGLRLRNGLEVDDEGALRTLKPALFNEAFPRMIAPKIEAGQRVRLTGVSEAGAIEFTIPSLALTAEIVFGERLRGDVPLRIDQIGIEPDAGRFFLSYRAPFRYKIHAHETRTCRIVLA